MIIHTMAPKIETMMTGVVEARQVYKGGAITLYYIDGSAEKAAGKGKRLGYLQDDGSVAPGDFSTLFEIVSHVQSQRPKTRTFIP